MRNILKLADWNLRRLAKRRYGYKLSGAEKAAAEWMASQASVKDLRGWDTAAEMIVEFAVDFPFSGPEIDVEFDGDDSMSGSVNISLSWRDYIANFHKSLSRFLKIDARVLSKGMTQMRSFLSKRWKDEADEALSVDKDKWFADAEKAFDAEVRSRSLDDEEFGWPSSSNLDTDDIELDVQVGKHFSATRYLSVRLDPLETPERDEEDIWDYKDRLRHERLNYGDY
jgi:hypothetical protein